MSDIEERVREERAYPYGAWIIRNRWLVIALALVATAMAAFGVQNLSSNPDNRVFFSKDNPHLLALEALENTYRKQDNLMFVLAPGDGDVFGRDTLAAIEKLTEESWQIPFSTRVDSITNFQHTQADGDDLLVGNLVENPAQLSDSELAELRDTALARPELVNRIISEDGGVTAVNVLVTKPDHDREAVPRIVEKARAMAAAFEAENPDIALYMTGGVMYDAAFSEIPEAEMSTLLLAMFVLVLLIIGIALRTVVGVFATLLVIAFSVLVAMGLTGWAGAELNAGTMSAPVIILTLSVAHCVHILANTRLELARGREKRAAIIESLRLNMAPVFITSITTAVGFLSMNFSDAPPFRLLGTIVAIGVMAGFALSVTFLPALLAVLPMRGGAKGAMGARMMEWLAEQVVANRTAFLWGTGAVILLLALGLTRITLDDDFTKYFDERYPIRVASEFTEKNLTGINVIEYSVPAGEEGGINTPEYLARLEAFADWFRTQPNVVHVAVLTNTIKRLNQNMHGDDPAYYRIPESRDLAAQYLLVYEMSLPYGLDLNGSINVAKSASRMTVFVSGLTSKDMRELDARAQQWLAANAPDMAAPGTGLSMIFAHISERNINSMLFGSTLALILISLILILALRSVRVGLISLMPNLLPAIMAFGLWGYLYGQVGLSIAVVVAMTLGIVVDDTVHFLSKYLRARREHDLPPQDAVRYAFRTVGVALWTTSVTLVVGFSVLTVSGFKVTAEMGLLSAITIAFALAADFLFLPALLMRLDERRAAAGAPAPKTV